MKRRTLLYAAAAPLLLPLQKAIDKVSVVPNSAADEHNARRLADHINSEDAMFRVLAEAWERAQRDIAERWFDLTPMEIGP